IPELQPKLGRRYAELRQILGEQRFMVLRDMFIVPFRRGRQNMDHTRRCRCADCLEQLAIAFSKADIENLFNHSVRDNRRTGLDGRFRFWREEVEALRVLDRAVNGMLVPADHRDDEVVRSQVFNKLQERFEARRAYSDAVLLLEQTMRRQRDWLPLAFPFFDGAQDGMRVAVAEELNPRRPGLLASAH